MKERFATYESGKTITCNAVETITSAILPFTLTEIGTTGVYYIDFSGPAGTWILGDFKDGETTLDVYDNSPIIWDGSKEVGSFSPDPVTGDITLRQYNDYLSIDGGALTFSFDNKPSLIGATIYFLATSERDPTGLMVQGTVTSSKSVVFEPIRTQTVRLLATEYDYEIRATLATGSVVSYQSGTLTIEAAVMPRG